MVVRYARTSTTRQVAGLEAQSRDLSRAAVERIFSEQVSGVADRPEREAALDSVRGGDVFVVTKLDRLARSVASLLEIVARLDRKGVTLRILNLGLDTSTPTGKLMLTVMGGVAEFERSMMLERQREGIAKAKADGVYKGRRGRRDDSRRQERSGHRRGAGDLCRIGAWDAQARCLSGIPTTPGGMWSATQVQRVMAALA